MQTGLSGVDAGAAAAAFGALADEDRIAILLAFWPDYPTPVSYATLMDRAGFADSGRFAYHLDELQDGFVRKLHRGYKLLPPGRIAVEALAGGSFTEQVRTDYREVGVDCPDCGAAVVAWYRDGEMVVGCPDCANTVERWSFPPRRVVDRPFEDALAAFSAWTRQAQTLAGRGVCPFCGDRTESYVDRETDWTRLEFPAVTRCPGCESDTYATVGLRTLTHPAVVSFYHDLGVDVRERPWWEFPFCVGEDALSLAGEEPLRLELVIEEGGQRLRLTVDGSVEVIETARTG